MSLRSVPTRREIENSKKIAKKFKKLKNTIMASFQAKIDWRRPRKRENKNYRSVQTRNIKFQKKSRTIQKIKKKYHYGFISSHNRLETAEKERKWKLSFGFVPTRHIRDNSKKITKNFKKQKNPVMASFQAKICWKRPRIRENKICVSVPFLPDGK